MSNKDVPRDPLGQTRDPDADVARMAAAQARLAALFREVRDRQIAAEGAEEEAEEEPLDLEEWADAPTHIEERTASIPDLGASISRIRARLRERIAADETNYPRP